MANIEKKKLRLVSGAAERRLCSVLTVKTRHPTSDTRHRKMTVKVKASHLKKKTTFEILFHVNKVSDQ